MQGLEITLKIGLSLGFFKLTFFHNKLNYQYKKLSFALFTRFLVAMLFGVFCAIALSPWCIIAGIWQIAAGFIIIVIEVIAS